MANEPFKTLPPTYSQGSGPSMTQAQAEYAAERSQMLLGCYRKGDVADPDTFAAAVAAVLADYPMDVIRRATDPRNGLASKLKWIPSIAEVKEFCEIEMEPVYRHRAEQKRVEERKRALPPPVEDRSKRKTYEELKAEAGPNWGLKDFAEEKEKAKTVTRAEIGNANRLAFERECEQAGIDPAGGVSPFLLDQLRAKPAPTGGEP